MNPDRVRHKLGTFHRKRHEPPAIIKLAKEHGWRAFKVPNETEATEWKLSRGEQSCSLFIYNHHRWVEDRWNDVGPITRDKPGVGVHRFGDDFLVWLTAPGPIDDRQAKEQERYDREVAKAEAWLRGEAS